MKQLKKIFVLCTAMTVVMVLAGALWAEDSGKININTALVDELVQLNKIGQKYAERIVQYREKNGPFKNPEDIMQVPGIGHKIYEMNKDRIAVEQSKGKKS